MCLNMFMVCALELKDSTDSPYPFGLVGVLDLLFECGTIIHCVWYVCLGLFRCHSIPYIECRRLIFELPCYLGLWATIRRIIYFLLLYIQQALIPSSSVIVIKTFGLPLLLG